MSEKEEVDVNVSENGTAKESQGTDDVEEGVNATDDNSDSDEYANDNDNDNGDENEDDDTDGNSSLEPDDPPPCDKANSLSFFWICNRMEHLWQTKRQRNRTISEEQKKTYFLPTKMLQAMEGESIFPLFRLIMPDLDNSRNLYMKEKLIADAYCDVEGFSKGTKNFDALKNYTDPKKVPHGAAGDLSLVVEHILKDRIPENGSKVTVGQVNDFLDELVVSIQQRKGSYNHEWREGSLSQKSKSKPKPVKEVRERWLRKMCQKGLSPLEHKWLVRILLKKMEFGLSGMSILSYYNPFARQLYDSHNSLRNLCDKLADPEYTKMLLAERNKREAARYSESMENPWEPQEQPAQIGNIITPMRPQRTYFDSCMAKLQHNHTAYVKSLPDSVPSSVRNCLALRFPAICAEIKLDGERMLCHIQEGKVTVQSRNGKLYSRIYSPILGPPLRRAISKYRVNVILDGEVEAWDDGRKQLIPFGMNRTVAINRQSYLRQRNMLEKIDSNLHAGEDGKVHDPNVQLVGDSMRFIKDGENSESGKDCWLQYFVFDILYVDGPDASRLLGDCLMESLSPGSLIAYSLLQRKIILHQLLTPQIKQIETSKSIIIRPNGDTMLPEHYFSMSNPPLDTTGNHLAFSDSSQRVTTQIKASQEVPQILGEIADQDNVHRKGRSDEEISHLRTKAVNDFYRTIVEEQKMEGLVFKDLAAPYIFGYQSKQRKVWWKLKPDYEGGECVDVVILGAYFATGLRHSGQLSHFLCGVIDDDYPSLFMPALTVNGKSTNYHNLAKIMQLTGYRAASSENEVDLGRWEERDDLPDYISHRSFQDDINEPNEEGWKFNKLTFPDLWIDPKFSIVLELKGQEFVPTTAYASGMTMRFPRIKKIRHEQIDGDPKSAFEIDSHKYLHQLYYETMISRESNNEIDQISSADQLQVPMQFRTAEEFLRKKPAKRKKKRLYSPSKVPKVDHFISRVLENLSFTILEGNYSLDDESLEAQDAMDAGWYDKAKLVKCKEDVMKFIKSHSGQVKVSLDKDKNTFVIGGEASDARVQNYMKGIKNARELLSASKTKTKKMIELEDLAEREGVLKWTFVYSSVYRWLDEKKVPDSAHHMNPIRESNLRILRPKVYDYLAKASTREGSTDYIFDLEYQDEITKLDLLRALEDPMDIDTNESSFRPWQHEKYLSFDVEDRWVLNSSDRSIFEQNPDNVQQRSIFSDSAPSILYPDVFGNDLQHQESDSQNEEWPAGLVSSRSSIIEKTTEAESIVATLPLASALGMIISPYVHKSVRFIMCSRTALGKKIEDFSKRNDQQKSKQISIEDIRAVWNACYEK